MATTLWINTAPQPTCVLNTNNPRLDGTNTLGWFVEMLTARGTSGGVESPSANTVAGPTNGLEVHDASPSGNVLEYISAPLAAGATISGTMTFNAWASESAAGANVAINFVVERIQPDGTLTQIIKTANTTELGTTNPPTSATNFTGTPTSTVMAKGDRFRVRIFGDDAGTMGAGFTFEADVGGAVGTDGETYVRFTEDLIFDDGAPIYNTSGTQAFSATNSWSFTTTPAGTLENDIMLAWISWENTTDTINSVPAGWTLINSITGTTVISGALYWKRASAGEAGPYVWGFTGNTTGGIAIASYSGCARTITPYEATSFKGDAAATTSHTATNTATPTKNCHLQANFIAVNLAATSTPQFSNILNAQYIPTERVDFEASGFVELGVFDNWRPEPTGAGGFNVTSAVSAVAVMAVIHLIPVHYDYQLFLTNTNSPVAGSNLEKEMWTSRDSGVVSSTTNSVNGWTTGTQITDSAGGTALEWYTKALQAFTLTGPLLFQFWARQASAAGQAARIELAIVNGDGTGATIWSAVGAVGRIPTGQGGELPISGTTRSRLFGLLSGPDTAVAAGQRLRLRVYDDDSSQAQGSGGTMVFGYGGNTAEADGDTWLSLRTLPQAVAGTSPVPARVISWLS